MSLWESATKLEEQAKQMAFKGETFERGRQLLCSVVMLSLYTIFDPEFYLNGRRIMDE